MPPTFPSALETGTTLIHESSSPIALVISIGDFYKDGAKMTEDFVLQALVAAGDKPPIIVVNGASEELIQEIRQKLVLIARKIPVYKRFKKVWPSLVVQGESVEGQFQWQQDFFKPMFDPKTGFPVLRDVRDSE